jgi:hypothetical protein
MKVHDTMSTPVRIHLAIIIVGTFTSITSAQSTLPKAQHDSLWAVWSDHAQADISRLKAIGRTAVRGYMDGSPDPVLNYAQMHTNLHMTGEIELIPQQRKACECLYDTYKAIG